MAEPRNLDELFKRVVTFSGKDTKDCQMFYEDWLKICKIRPFHMVLQAWEQIKLETTFFLSLKLWNDKLDYLEDRAELDKPKAKQTRVEMDEDMKAWTENLRQFRAGEITRKEYLGNALKSGQLKPHEFQKEVTRYEYLGLDMNKTVDNTKINNTADVEPF